jgi:hypothetical protein
MCARGDIAEEVLDIRYRVPFSPSFRFFVGENFVCLFFTLWCFFLGAAVLTDDF